MEGNSPISEMILIPRFLNTRLLTMGINYVKDVHPRLLLCHSLLPRRTHYISDPLGTFQTNIAWQLYD